MQATIINGARDIRFEDRPEPTVTKPTDAIIPVAATCVCGSDLWPYRGIAKIEQPTPMGHEYCGIATDIVTERGDEGIARIKDLTGRELAAIPCLNAWARKNRCRRFVPHAPAAS